MPEEEKEKRQLFEKHGVRYNGFRIPYPIVGAFMLVVSSTAVSLYQIQQLMDWRDQREPKIVEFDRRLSVIESRLGNIEYMQRRRMKDAN